MLLHEFTYNKTAKREQWPTPTAPPFMATMGVASLAHANREEYGLLDVVPSRDYRIQSGGERRLDSMRAETEEILVELQHLDWFHAVGQPVDGDVTAVGTWQEAVRAAGAHRWQKIKLA